jgi:uncharacterized protein (TIGR02147 family)
MDYLSFDDYRELLRWKISQLPAKGRGQIEKLARHLHVHQSFVSQVLGGKKDFSEEQLYRVSQYFELTEPQTEYLLALLQAGRATHPGLKQIAERNLRRLKSQARAMPVDNLEVTPLSERERSVFYSSWYYSAVRLLTSIDGLNSASTIAARLHLPVAQVQVVLEFLVKAGLVAQKGGRYEIGPRRTLISGDSPALSRHHMNWRMRALEALQRDVALPTCYTSPMTLSASDIKEVQRILHEAISKIEPLVEPSPAEDLYCLNIDWFKV